jgi:hypothetical protein
MIELIEVSDLFNMFCEMLVKLSLLFVLYVSCTGCSYKVEATVIYIQTCVEYNLLIQTSI